VLGRAGAAASGDRLLRRRRRRDARCRGAGGRGRGGGAGWARYYDPLEVALAGERDTDLVAAFRAEIALWKRWGESYDYRLFVVEPA